jgi:hypothetical protein
VLNRAVVAVSVLALAGLPVDLGACGDKFLVPGRSGRFRAVDRESATVLLYARPGSALDETLKSRSVVARLRAAGYRPTRVGGPENLESAFRAGGWDVVVADLSDASGLVGRLPAAGAPLVLPVLYEASRAAVAEARRQYRRVLRSPRGYQAFLEAIDDLIHARAKARATRVASARG